MQRFIGKTVIVTGAGTGIGAATAWRFGAEGANVVLAGRRADKLADTATALKPDRTLVHAADISQQASVQALVQAAVARFGTLDVLVNNAAAFTMGSFHTAPENDWHSIMRTNLDGVYYTSRAAMPHLLASGGNIVNVSSVSGLAGDWGFSFYNASKGAVSNLTRALALEYGRAGVRINAVCPGLTVTEMTEPLKQNRAVMQAFENRIPLGRPAEAAEVAAVIAFLASSDAAFVTGVNLPVDGGLHASNGQPNLGGAL